MIATGPEPGPPSASPNRLKAGKAAWKDLDLLCRTAIHKDPKKRYQTVIGLSQDLDAYLYGQPLKAQPVKWTYRLSKFIKRNLRPISSISVGAAILVGVVIFFTLRLAQERDLAIRQTAIAASINHFLAEDLLGRSDPFRSQNAQESFADAVSRSSPQIDIQFRAEPGIAAQLHAILAKAFENRSDFARARQEYDHAAASIARTRGGLSADAITLRLRRAVMEAISFQPDSLKTAESLVRDAQRAIPKLPSQNTEVSTWLAYAQGAIAIVQNDAHAANRRFSEALRLAQSSSSLDAISQTSMNQMIAFSYVRLDEGAKAEPLLRRVISDYGKRYGPHAPDVLRARGFLAMALMRQHKYAEAIKEVDGIYPTLVKNLGEDNQITLSALGTRAASEGYLRLWDNAIRDDLAMYNASVQKLGPLAFHSLVSLADAALSQCRAGRYQEGELNARKAFTRSRQAFGPRAAVTGGSSYAFSICLIGRNKLEEASSLLGNIDASAVAQFSGDSTVSASIALAQGQIAARRGDYATAEHYAQSAAPAIDSPTSDVSDREELSTLRKVISSHLHAAR